MILRSIIIAKLIDNVRQNGMFPASVRDNIRLCYGRLFLSRSIHQYVSGTRVSVDDVLDASRIISVARCVDSEAEIAGKRLNSVEWTLARPIWESFSFL
jgi:hypothetical protein